MSVSETINVIIGGGKKVHSAHTWLDDRDKSKPPVRRIGYTACGADQCSTGHRHRSRLRETTAPVNCERCLQITGGPDGQA